MMTPDDMIEIICRKVDVPVIYEFWAPYCGPCKSMIPIMENLSKIFGNKVMFYYIDVDKWPEIADKFHVIGTPTFILYKNSEEKERFTGLFSEEFLINIIERNLQ